jgi:hypothetical protein
MAKPYNVNFWQQKRKIILMAESDLIKDILDVVTDLRQTAHVHEDVANKLQNIVDIGTKDPEKIRQKLNLKIILSRIIIILINVIYALQNTRTFWI